MNIKNIALLALFLAFLTNTGQSTILHDAVQDNSLATVEALLKQLEIDINEADEYGQTALWWAAERNNPDIITYLLEKKATVDAPARDGSTPLHIAALEGNHEAVKLLLEDKAKPNLKDNKGNTPLHDAARGENWQYPSTDPEFKKCDSEKLEDYLKTISLLKKYGASTTIKNNKRLTPAEVAKKQQQKFYPENKVFSLADLIDTK
ncbi:ankyrin repeat domain-containing protein [bacterium]|nr:MAG: ankyrin repeat domain-containing protein [bacterium]